MYFNDNDHYDYGHTGDPHLDKEYERNNYYNKMPENVKMFILNFRAAIKDGVMFEIQNLYENTFPQLSDQYYDKSSWPNEEEVLELLEMYDKDYKDDKDDKDVFIILYKELYYRHIHARMPNNLDLSQRTNSFLNYCDFFNLLLSEEEPVVLELPDIWLWELIDEFVYQFQNFAQYRARLSDKTPSEMNQLSNGNNNWSILCILNVLHSLVDISNIKKQLEAMSAGIDPRTVAGKYGEHSFYKMLGYFSLIGLLRLHSLLGDYYQAIKVLEPIEIHKKSQYSHIPACQISMSYYIGFAYMMMRRYSDAIRTFSSILLYIQRTKQLYSSRSYQNDQINKQTDQMYQLLSICLVLHPQCIDESIQQVLREKNYHENMCRMQCGEVEAFENYFSYSCPKFVSPVPPPQDAPIDDYVKDPLQHQLKVFLDEVKQQLKLPTIRSYLKLYTTLPLEKLASFMKNQIRSDEEKQKEEEKKNEEQSILKPPPELPLDELLLIHLLCFKHKMKNIVWTKGSSGLEGKFQSGSELDFYIDNDMIHIADTKVSHRYGDFFIRKILKFEDLNHRLHSIHIK